MEEAEEEAATGERRKVVGTMLYRRAPVKLPVVVGKYYVLE